jgi:hypothetical protein
VWGTHFTCFTGTKVQILTLLLLADLEMQRLTVKEKEKEAEAKRIVVLANLFVFTPIALAFITNVRQCLCPYSHHTTKYVS